MTKHLLKDGKNLLQYCREHNNNPSYFTAVGRIRAGMTPDQAVKCTGKKPSVPRIVHGKPFRVFCKEHGLSYTRLYSKWRNLTVYNKFHKIDISLEDFVDGWLRGERFEDHLRPEIYDRHYCISKGINYTSTYGYWITFKKSEYTFREYVDLKIKRQEKINGKGGKTS